MAVDPRARPSEAPVVPPMSIDQAIAATEQPRSA
jgi:hypothetical protein